MYMCIEYMLALHVNKYICVSILFCFQKHPWLHVVPDTISLPVKKPHKCVSLLLKPSQWHCSTNASYTTSVANVSGYMGWEHHGRSAQCCTLALELNGIQTRQCDVASRERWTTCNLAVCLRWSMEEGSLPPWVKYAWNVSVKDITHV